ncbi:hypothetical protein KI387_011127, partial [Taxus chinensis]
RQASESMEGIISNVMMSEEGCSSISNKEDVPMHCTQEKVLEWPQTNLTQISSSRDSVMLDKFPNTEFEENGFDRLPDHLLIEIFVRLPASDWAAASCVQERCATLFRGEGLWKAALARRWPSAGKEKRWPGPIGRGLSKSKRRYTALYVSKNIFSFSSLDGDIDELTGHAYLFLKEQLELSVTHVSYGLLHGTIIDQFLACGKERDTAHELASKVWLAVINNLEENEHTFKLLMQIAEEWE